MSALAVDNSSVLETNSSFEPWTTVTVTTVDFSPAVIVMFAVPSLTAVTRPVVSSTVATSKLSEANVALLVVVFEGAIVYSIFLDWPTFNSNAVSLVVIDSTATVSSRIYPVA